jgi:thiol-disulfide isomerase/thioredoxin
MYKVHEITDIQDHDSFIANNKNVIIFFGAEKCGHCRNMTVIFQQMCRDYPFIKFAHVEVTKVKSENVDGIPVFAGYKMHEPIDVIIGADPDAIINMIETKFYK